MAERRMFHTAVVESDAFLDMPIGAQALYFHLGMQADEDGFVNGPKQIARMLRRPPKELRILEENGFVLNFDGIMVITHWRMANTLQNDRLHLLRYPEIARKIYLNEAKVYCLEGVERENLYLYKNALLESNRNPSKAKPSKAKRNKAELIIAESNRKDIPPGDDGRQESIVPDFGEGGEQYDDTYVLLHRFGKDLVHLTRPQIEGLRRIMGEVEMEVFVDRLAKLIQEGEDPGEHYKTIKNWYLERSSQNV